jgi:hypothetical protein
MAPKMCPGPPTCWIKCAGGSHEGHVVPKIYPRHPHALDKMRMALARGLVWLPKCVLEAPLCWIKRAGGLHEGHVVPKMYPRHAHAFEAGNRENASSLQWEFDFQFPAITFDGFIPNLASPLQWELDFEFPAPLLMVLSPRQHPDGSWKYVRKYVQNVSVKSMSTFSTKPMSTKSVSVGYIFMRVGSS